MNLDLPSASLVYSLPTFAQRGNYSGMLENSRSTILGLENLLEIRFTKHQLSNKINLKAVQEVLASAYVYVLN